MHLIIVSHLAVTSFYLSKNGHFSISLVDGNHSADVVLCQSLKGKVSSSVVSWGPSHRERCGVFSFTAWYLVFWLTSLIHSFLLSSFGTFQKMPHLSSHAILPSHFGFSHLSLSDCSLFLWKLLFVLSFLLLLYLFFLSLSLSPYHYWPRIFLNSLIWLTPLSLETG